MSRQGLKNKVVSKLLRKRVIGNKKRSVDTIKNWFSSSDQGDVKEVIEELATDPSSPVFKYGGGARENVRLTGAQEAVEYLDENDGEIPFGFEE